MRLLNEIRRLFRYFKRVLSWAKFLHKERVEEWDYSHLCSIFAFALRRHAAYIEISDRHEEVPFDVERMRECADAIERFGQDRYGDEKLTDIAERYDWYGDGARRVMKAEEHPTLGILYRHVDERPQEVKDMEAKEMRELAEYEEKCRKKDLNKFCNIIKCNIREWWD